MSRFCWCAALASLVVGLAAGCKKDAPTAASRPLARPSSNPPPAAREPGQPAGNAHRPPPAAPKDAPLPPLASVEPKPGPVKVVPKIVVETRASMMDHPHIIGWSKESATFGYCVQNGGSGCLVCELLPVGGKARRLSDCTDEGEPSKAAHARVKKELRRLGLGQRPKSWPFGGDLEFHWTSKGRVTVGARLRGDKKGHYPVRLPSMDDAAVMVEAVVVSPDGKWVGVLGHTFAGEFSDTFPMKVVSAGSLAASAYNTAGYLRHKKGDFSEAEQLFARAAAADPQHPHALYNRACALARAEKPEARTALVHAIERDGDPVRQRARTDEDFDGVRDRAWFQDLVGDSTDSAKNN